MMIIVSYDVSTITPEGRKRLRRVAKVCVNHGIRVQNSVFECNVDQSQWVKMKSLLEKEYNPVEDSLRFYYLGNNYHNKVEHLGAKPAIDVEDTLII